MDEFIHYYAFEYFLNAEKVMMVELCCGGFGGEGTKIVVYFGRRAPQKVFSFKRTPRSFSYQHVTKNMSFYTFRL